MGPIVNRIKDSGQIPRGEQVKEQIKEQAAKPENRRRLADFGRRYLKRR
jgi:hypothetical protein